MSAGVLDQLMEFCGRVGGAKYTLMIWIHLKIHVRTRTAAHRENIITTGDERGHIYLSTPDKLGS